MNAVTLGAIWLRVEEVDKILESLRDSKALKNLNGGQRQQLEDAINGLSDARKHATMGKAELTIELVTHLLCCMAHTQEWLQDVFDDFAGVE